MGRSRHILGEKDTLEAPGKHAATRHWQTKMRPEKPLHVQAQGGDYRSPASRKLGPKSDALTRVEETQLRMRPRAHRPSPSNPVSVRSQPWCICTTPFGKGPQSSMYCCGRLSKRRLFRHFGAPSTSVHLLPLVDTTDRRSGTARRCILDLRHLDARLFGMQEERITRPCRSRSSARHPVPLEDGVVKLRR